MSTPSRTTQLTEARIASKGASSKGLYYPESDGKPMAETDIHRDVMIDLITSLKAYYRDEPDVYVSGNLLLYYEEDNARKSVAPDVFVVKGVGSHLRRTYLLWEEGKGPDVVIELTSKKTKNEDSSKKHNLYEQVLNVPEYFLYDPTEDYLDPPFQGCRLEQGHYVPMVVVEDRLRSEELGLDLVVEEGELRLYDVETGKRLPTPKEESEMRREAEAERELQARARRVAEAERERENRARRQADAEVERLRAELTALRKRLADADD